MTADAGMTDSTFDSRIFKHVLQVCIESERGTWVRVRISGANHAGALHRKPAAVAKQTPVAF